MEATKRTAAFFDIDGTLYREGLITATFKKLIKSEIIEQERWYNEVRERYAKWDKRIGNYDDYLLKMAQIYVEAVKGLHKSQIQFIAKRVVEQNGDRVYTYTRDRILHHKNNNHIVIAVSGSPHELVAQMSLKHGFDDYIGTKYETDSDGIFTGRMSPMWDSKNKAKALHSFADKYSIDLSLSYAYGDTAGDFSMLETVKHPFAVNPTRELLAKLKKSKKTRDSARVVVERKDMIYRFNLSYFNFD